MYRTGVLIHNHNEDRFGQDLQTIPKPADPPMVSISHTVHNWKDADYTKGVESGATGCIDRHLFFGHSGDMTDPHTNLQKTEFMSNTNYFYRDPAKLAGGAHAGVGTLTADKYSLAEVDTSAAFGQSYIADKTKAGWAPKRSHALKSSDRFKTTNSVEMHGDLLQKMGPAETQFGRSKGDISGFIDKVQVTRDIGRIGSLKSASAVALRSR
jgi:hypothetical protein